MNATKADLIAELMQTAREMDEHTLDQVVNFANIAVYVTRIPKANQILQEVVNAQDLQSAQVLAVQASHALVHGATR